MSSGWEVYYVLFLSAAWALVFPLTLKMVSWILTRGERVPQQEEAIVRSGEPNLNLASNKMNTRFYLAVNSGSILIVLALALIPAVGAMGGWERSGLENIDKGTLLRGIIAVLSLAFFLSLGLFYSSKKGDLSWVRVFRSNEESK